MYIVLANVVKGLTRHIGDCKTCTMGILDCNIRPSMDLPTFRWREVIEGWAVNIQSRRSVIMGRGNITKQAVL